MAYPTSPTAPPPAAWTGTRSDSTDVMGRRIGAYLLDGLIGVILAVGLTLLLVFTITPWNSHRVSDPDRVCTAYTNRHENSSKECVSNGDDRVYLVNIDAIFAMVGGSVVAIWLLDHVLLEGLAGGTLGKLLLGLRVVRVDGRLAGVGRATVRNLLLIVDQFFFSVVGLITSFTTDGHQRVGDMVASTYVVDRSSVGYPVVTPDSRWTTSFAPPGGGAGGYQPQQQPRWDAARNAYIYWDDQAHEWLVHDPATNRWTPIR